MLMRCLTLLLAAALSTACGDTCESLQKELTDIGREIRKNPEIALDRAKELSDLRDKLMDKDCM